MGCCSSHDVEGVHHEDDRRRGGASAVSLLSDFDEAGSTAVQDRSERGALRDVVVDGGDGGDEDLASVVADFRKEFEQKRRDSLQNLSLDETESELMEEQMVKDADLPEVVDVEEHSPQLYEVEDVLEMELDDEDISVDFEEDEEEEESDTMSEPDPDDLSDTDMAEMEEELEAERRRAGDDDDAMDVDEVDATSGGVKGSYQRQPKAAVAQPLSPRFSSLALSDERSEALALYDFDGDIEKGQLSFKRDDIILIELIERDEDWWRAEIDGVSGYVPRTYVTLLQKEIKLDTSKVSDSILKLQNSLKI
eukprot:TRINITY_DN176_c4_g1_i1.p1 TRINITY_DN176_c4_g1~~TRINITY_DN176_c4_g1_i1.p1  ORF type:complete len:308 (-),score=97.56 TRINITY_DN176_c4_g1_i1:252-1175(-)